MIQTTVKTLQLNQSSIHNVSSLPQQCKSINQLKQLHAHILKTQFPQNPHAMGPLLSTLAISNPPLYFSYAHTLFHSLPIKTTFMYNTMIRGFIQKPINSPNNGIIYYLDMLNYGLNANNYTYPPLIKACTLLFQCFGLNFGNLVHAHVVKFGLSHDPFVVSSFIEFYSVIGEMGLARMLFDRMYKRDVVVWTAMVDGYGKVGDVENARVLFEAMPERNVIAWSAMMAGYSRISDFKEVLSLFRRMQDCGTKPNEAVLVSVLTACAHLGALVQGLWVHSYANRYNLESNTILATALVDMYSKCGCVESALYVFEGIQNKDAGAWNAIISGVAMNGDARKSLELFYEMRLYGTQPTETTFVALLTACTHAKLVKEGLQLFEQMDSIFGVQIRPEHHACVVDLLARSGMLEEAEKFIDEKMGGVEVGDINVWGALLGGCRVHGNVEIGNRVWRKLADMGLADCGTHILSYNIYQEAGWELEAKRVRRLISEVGMKKQPGCSIIEVDDTVEEFLAGGLCHPQAQEIHKILYSLSKVMNLEEILFYMEWDYYQNRQNSCNFQISS